MKSWLKFWVSHSRSFSINFLYLTEFKYEERLSRSRLWSLEERRSRDDLIEVFKMMGISEKRQCVRTMVFFLQPSERQHNQRPKLETEKETLSYRYSILLLLSANCQPLEQSVTERHWCYDFQQLQIQKSAREKKKSWDGLLQRLTVFQVLLVARSLYQYEAYIWNRICQSSGTPWVANYQRNCESSSCQPFLHTY